MRGRLARLRFKAGLRRSGHRVSWYQDSWGVWHAMCVRCARGWDASVLSGAREALARAGVCRDRPGRRP